MRPDGKKNNFIHRWIKMIELINIDNFPVASYSG
jgi:hypothetical protein